jgi:hypothetical protein
VRNLKNRELTKLIGRRLIEALGDGEDMRLPPEISDRLEALRRAERREAEAIGGVAIDIGAGDDDDERPAAAELRDATR